MSLRPIQDGDEGFLRLVYAESRREELAQVMWPEGAQEAFLRMQFDAQNHHYIQYYPGAEFFIIELEGESVGRLYVQRRPSEILVIDIALLPSARGKGIGTKLLGDTLNEAQVAGKTVSIHVEKFNQAQKLYFRLGFELVEDKGVYLFLQRKPIS